MSPHPVLVKWIIRFQMIMVVFLIVLGSLYALSPWINNSLLTQAVDPIIGVVSTVGVYGLFYIPVVWIVGRSIFVRVFSRHVPVELKERLQRLALEALRRMGINPGSTRFVVGRRSFSASVRRSFRRDTIAVGDQLLRDASDEEIMAILGHELGHILKRHFTIKGVWNVLFWLVFLPAIYELGGQSHSALILGMTGLLVLFLAGVPLSWRVEYSADRFSAEKLGPSPMVSALERLKGFSPDCVSFTHPPLSRRIRRIRELPITPLITHVYG